MGQHKRAVFNRDDVQAFVESVFEDVHAKRVLSIANATTGVLTSASLAVSAIGQGMAHALGLRHKHSAKQVDRLLSNPRFDVWDYFRYWVPHLVGERKAIVVALDWTDFDRDGQTTIALNLLTDHGRAIPMVWKTVCKSALKERRNEYEDAVLHRLHDTLPDGVAVTVVADRGFMDTKLLEELRDSLHFGYIIRLRGDVTVTATTGEKRTAEEWVGRNGRTKTLRKAGLTAKGFVVPTIVCTKAKDMKEPWCLASSDEEAVPADLMKYYGKRWGIETYFRDTKDLRFGMGMDAIHLKTPARRDRLFLISALAIVLLTLLGTVSESTGYDRYLKTNTAKHRTVSLFRQGLMIYDLLPNMREGDLQLLMVGFNKAVREQAALAAVFSGA